MAEQKTDPKNPYMFFDVTKIAAEFDPAKIMGNFQKSFGDLKLPGFDTSAIMETQRKNIEAMTTANRVALEGMQAMMRRQSEILQQAMQELTDTLKTYKADSKPEDVAATQIDQAKAAFEKAMANARELAEMSAKSNTEAAEAINKRFTESMDEFKDMLLKLKK